MIEERIMKNKMNEVNLWAPFRLTYRNVEL